MSLLRSHKNIYIYISQNDKGISFTSSETIGAAPLDSKSKPFFLPLFLFPTQNAHRLPNSMSELGVPAAGFNTADVSRTRPPQAWLGAH